MLAKTTKNMQPLVLALAAKNCQPTCVVVFTCIEYMTARLLRALATSR